ncbi:MAG: ArsR family transcriptional regulator [Armatimonadetes bacterium]|nr:ArsR family transcriptional regulator [Armatimonadota bacterium]
MSERALLQPITNERGYLTALRWQGRFREALARPELLGQGVEAGARQGILRTYEQHLAELSARLAEYEGLSGGQSDAPPARAPEHGDLTERIAGSWVHGTQVAARLAELRQDLRSALASTDLSSLEVAVLALLFGQEMTVSECARTLGTPPAAVSAARTNALRKLADAGLLDSWADALTTVYPAPPRQRATG